MLRRKMNKKTWLQHLGLNRQRAGEAAQIAPTH